MLIHCLLNKSQKNEQKAQAKAYRLEILMTNSIWAESIRPTPSPRQLGKRWLCWLSPSHCRHNHPHCCHRIHRLLLLPQMPSPFVSAARVGNGEELSTPPPPRVAITATRHHRRCWRQHTLPRSRSRFGAPTRCLALRPSMLFGHWDAVGSSLGDRRTSKQP